MLNQVSWSEYFSVLITVVVIYYLLVLFIYYRQDIQQLLSGKSPRLAGPTSSHPPNNSASSGNSTTLVPTSDADRSLYDDAARLMQELSPIFNKNYVKQELITALQVKLSEYPALKGSAFQEAVNKYIATESEKCSIHLSEFEMRGIWTR
jgi:hypothetical protein